MTQQAARRPGGNRLPRRCGDGNGLHTAVARCQRKSPGRPGWVSHCHLRRGVRKLVEDAEPKWHEAQEALIETIGEDRWRAMSTVLRDTTRMVRHRADAAD